ncbi:alpha/beta fold hydrolase [Aurantimonas sp. A2-1-M11]|uniref:alpha/beta fold hydrolase n=1 Tax=Aurantimonas sp. A2-1-M11 TaxID=3113712 RepID=UPI002F949649
MIAFTVSTPDGAVLNARSEGSGPALVLVSGLGGTAGFWDPVVEGLRDRFEVLTFDQRGIAASTRGRAETDIALLADDLRAVLDAAEIDRAIIVGHSTGGCIAQSLSARAPERVAGLGLSATWLRPSRYMRALFTARLELLRNDPIAYTATATLISYAPAWLEAHWTVYERAIAKAPTGDAARQVVAERLAALLAFDGSAEVSALTMPTLVFGAEDDMIVPAFLQRDLAEALPSANLRLLADGGHFYPVSRTKVFVREIAEWAGSLPSSTALAPSRAHP